MSLYAITGELKSLMAAAETHGLESDDFAEALKEHSELLIKAFDEKADDYAALIRICETRAEAREDEAKRMQALSDADAALANRLRTALLNAMRQIDRKRVDTARFSLCVRLNGGKMPVIITSEDVIPAKYKIPSYSERVDKDALREALEKGVKIDGASLGERGMRLDLK